MPGRRPRPGTSGGHELQRDPVQAMALACRLRPVVEDMTEVTAAAAAMHFGAHHEELAVGLRADGIGQRLPEARPSGAAVVLVLRRIDGQIAALAVVGAGVVDLV